MGRIKDYLIECEQFMEMMSNPSLCDELRIRLHTEMNTCNNEDFEQVCHALIVSIDNYLDWESIHGKRKGI